MQSRLDRMFCKLRDWEPLAVEIVGREPIPCLTGTVSWCWQAGVGELEDRASRRRAGQ